jgi:hypothetical protein
MRMVNFANWLCCEGELTYSIADVTPCLIVLTSDASLTVFYSTFLPRGPRTILKLVSAPNPWKHSLYTLPLKRRVNLTVVP